MQSLANHNTHGRLNGLLKATSPLDCHLIFVTCRPACEETVFVSKIQQQYAWPTKRNQLGILANLDKSTTLYKDLHYAFADNSSENMFFKGDHSGLNVKEIVKQGVLATSLANVKVWEVLHFFGIPESSDLSSGVTTPVPPTYHSFKFCYDCDITVPYFDYDALPIKLHCMYIPVCYLDLYLHVGRPIANDHWRGSLHQQWRSWGRWPDSSSSPFCLSQFWKESSTHSFWKIPCINCVSSPGCLALVTKALTTKPQYLFTCTCFVYVTNFNPIRTHKRGVRSDKITTWEIGRLTLRLKCGMVWPAGCGRSYDREGVSAPLSLACSGRPPLYPSTGYQVALLSLYVHNLFLLFCIYSICALKYIHRYIYPIHRFNDLNRKAPGYTEKQR